MSLLQEGKGTDEAIENRNYLAKRMTDEISEVILFLIHLHIDEWMWSSFQLQVMRILEESAQTDNSGKIVNGMNGLNLTDMTFHEVAMTMRKRKMEWKGFLLQVTKKISQVLGGSGDAGACHQLVNHLVQLGYKVTPTLSIIWTNQR